MKYLASIFKPTHILLGLALALAGCSEGDFQTPRTITFGEADELQIQPIRVCDDSGNNCAGVNLFRDITEKILAQAKLRVSFLPERQLNASRFLSINDSSDRSSSDYEFYELTRTGGRGAFGRNPDSTETSGPINVWFVDTIEASNGFTQFGLAWVDANGILISQEALEFNGTGRADTLAHEVGHNLGLRHSTLGAGGSDNLLTGGDRRNIPGSADDITPDGAGLSTLTTAQIQAILDSPFINSGTPGSVINSEVVNGDIHSYEIHSHGTHSHSHEIHSHSHEIHSHSHGIHSHDSHLHLPDSQASRHAPLVEADSTNVVRVPDVTNSWMGLSILGVFIFARHRKRSAITHD